MIKNKKCWIITDGKIGTVNQAIGLADKLVSKYELKTIKLNKFWNKINPYIRCDYINPCADKDVIKGPLPDIVISAGRPSVSVALHIKKKKPDVILIAVQNVFVSPNKFDFIVAPEHDKYRAPNVISTLGAMNKLTEKALKQDTKTFEKELSVLKGKETICVILGGTSANHTFLPDRAQEICDQLKEIKKDLDANIVITASRRTPLETFKVFQKEFGSLDNVYIWDNNGSNPYFAFLDKADYIFVTNESVSMMGDAVWTGKPVYLIKLIGRSKKIEKYQNKLIDMGVVRILGEDKIEKYKYSRIENEKQVADKIEKTLKKRGQI